MSEKRERVFADGFSFRKPTGDAPEYVVGRLSLKADDAMAFVNANKNANGWINLSITAALANLGGTNTTETFAPVADIASATVLKTGSW